MLSFLETEYAGGELNDIIYDACVAKFFAETEPSVGESTVGIVRSYGEKVEMIEWETINDLRDIWKQQGAPRRVKNIPAETFKLERVGRPKP